MTNKNPVLFTLTVSMDANGLLTVKLEGNPPYDLLNKAIEEVCYQVDEIPVALDKTLKLDDDGDFYEVIDDDSVTELDADDGEGSDDLDADGAVADAADDETEPEVGDAE